MREHYIKKFSDGAIAFISVMNEKLYKKRHPESDISVEGTSITRIEVPIQYREKGVARELLTKVIKDADKECEELMIQPSPDDGTQESYDRLVKFYSEFDFKPSEHFTMKRKSKCLQRDELIW